MPASCTSHAKDTPVASSTRRVARVISGPVPSPGISVTRCDIDPLSNSIELVPVIHCSQVECGLPVEAAEDRFRRRGDAPHDRRQTNKEGGSESKKKR